MPKPPASPRLAPAEPSAATGGKTGKRKAKRAEVAENEEAPAAEEAAVDVALMSKAAKRKAAAATTAVDVGEEAEEACEQDAIAARKAAKRKRREAAATATAIAKEASESTAEPEAEPEVRSSKKRRKDREEVEPEESTGRSAVPSSASLAREEPEQKGLLSAEAFRSKFQISSAVEGQALPEPVQTFDDAPFGKKVRAALTAAGFAAPSPIQAQGWPVAAAGQDLVAVAKTGSGKTLGYLLPAFRSVAQRVKAAAAEAEPRKKAPARPLALVLAPTRELAVQIEEECVRFGGCAKVRSQVVFGGVPKPPQVKALREEEPQVLVATPGRLQDLMEMGVVELARVAFLVLDEADRMLDMGFEPEIAKILATMPEDRQTTLFTATWPKAVQKIATKYLRSDFVHVNVGQTQELAANTAVSQEFYRLGDDEKENKLWGILGGLSDDAKLILFTNTKRRVDALTKAFQGRGFPVSSLHGDKAQWERDREMAQFTSGENWLLFATDVCARGLDIQGVTHVVNYDMARDVEQYVHRIGRTGRAGATGASITFWNEAYDQECAPALAKIAREAGQAVPEWLEKASAKQKQVKNKGWRY